VASGAESSLKSCCHALLPALECLALGVAQPSPRLRNCVAPNAATVHAVDPRRIQSFDSVYDLANGVLVGEDAEVSVSISPSFERAASRMMSATAEGLETMTA
jgi:hypothetical protein